MNYFLSARPLSVSVPIFLLSLLPTFAIASLMVLIFVLLNLEKELKLTLSGKQFQHGFLKGRSTCTNLLECMNDWTLNIDLGCNTVIVYTDFAEGFDTVSHDKLMCKLYSYGIRGQLLLWLQHFFFDRTHQTKVGDSVSEFN